jgi:hypothetical protein
LGLAWIVNIDTLFWFPPPATEVAWSPIDQHQRKQQRFALGQSGNPLREVCIHRKGAYHTP